MAVVLQKDLNWVLTKTGFKSFYPEKLTRQTFFQLLDPDKFRKDGTGSYTLHHLCEVFIYKVKLCHNDARNLPSGKRARPGSYLNRGCRSPLRLSENIHPLDVIAVVYLCCDPIARQDLSRLLWECKFAIPFLIKPQQEDPVAIFTWPLKALKYRPFSRESWEKSVTDCGFSVISFLRLGQPRVSKSTVLNTVVCQSTEEYPVFFNRDSRASTRQRSTVTDGLVEVTFSSIQDTDMMFMNLRGDGLKERRQTEILFQMSDILIVLLEQENMTRVKQMLQDLEEMPNSFSILLLVTNMDADDDLDCTNITHALEELKVHANIDIIPTEKMTKPELLQEITDFAKSHRKSYHHFDELIGALVDLEVDENKTDYKTSASEAEQLVKSFNNQEIESLFPCQGHLFRKWAVANKGIYRDANNVQKHKQSLKMSRSLQFDLFKDQDMIINKFLKTFDQIKVNDRKRQIFLRSLNQTLENKYLRIISKCQEEHKRIMYIKASRKDDENDASHSTELLKLEENMSKTSITLSVFVKELGQMYEAFVETGKPSKEFEHLPEIAVNILMDGYPLEVMDGKTTTVPITWVNAVLERLNLSLQDINGKRDIRVRVISILGIQSSGKSTLLNTMFGPTFLVGSGRCTRGVYLHIVKVSPDVSKTEDIDYLLVLDGEGISALENEENLSRERELTTFVLGLADSTIINIMSENTIYVRDILPISVHAFLRMDLVGIDPKCTIAHQNVDPMNQQFMVQHWDDLKRTLDEYTKAACNLEGVKVQRFQEIVKLDITNDIHCFPPFRRQYGQVDVVNIGYSERAEGLLASVYSKKTQARFLNDFRRFLCLLWDALKKENFVYEFRNTVETEARLIADNLWCRCAWKLRLQSRKILTDLQPSVQKLRSVDECHHCFDKSTHDFLDRFQNCFDAQNQKLKVKFGKITGVFKEPVKRLRKHSIQKLKDLYDEILQHATQEIRSTFDLTQKEITLKIEDTRVVQEVTEYIKQHNKSLTVDRTEECESLFQKWLRSVTSQSEIVHHHKDRMWVIGVKTLHEAYPSHVTYISEKIQNHQDFDLLKFCANDSHFSNISRKTSEIDNTRAKANNIVEDIKKYVTEYFQKRCENSLLFNSDVFTELLTHFKDCEEIESGHLAAKKTFQIDLAICIIVYAWNQFQCRNDETETLAINELTRKRFREIYDGVLADERQKLNNCLKLITESVKDEVEKQLSNLVVEDFVKYQTHWVEIFRTKRTMLLCLLMDIIQENDGKQIYSYIKFEKGCMRAFICKMFDQYWSPIVISKFDTRLKELLSMVMDKVEQAISQSCTSTCASETWRQYFHAQLSKEINVAELESYMGDADVVFFRTEMVKSFGLKKDELLRTSCEWLVRDSEERIRIEVTELVLKHLVGCTAVCPCCREMCMYGQRSHEGKHKCLIHRPSLFKSSQSTEGCQTQIGNDSNDWDLTSLIENESAMQYICTIYHSGSDHQHEIPQEWKTLTAEEEVQKLLTLCKANDLH